MIMMTTMIMIMTGVVGDCLALWMPGYYYAVLPWSACEDSTVQVEIPAVQIGSVNTGPLLLLVRSPE